LDFGTVPAEISERRIDDDVDSDEDICENAYFQVIENFFDMVQLFKSYQKKSRKILVNNTFFEYRLNHSKIFNQMGLPLSPVDKQLSDLKGG
jgi:hypothetical protein